MRRLGELSLLNLDERRPEAAFPTGHHQEDRPQFFTEVYGKTMRGSSHIRKVLIGYEKKNLS